MRLGYDLLQRISAGKIRMLINSNILFLNPTRVQGITSIPYHYKKMIKPVLLAASHGLLNLFARAKGITSHVSDPNTPYWLGKQ
jgi:hypothetical protein